MHRERIAAILMGVAAGPAGWVVLGLIAIGTLIFQGKGLKDKIRSAFHESIPEGLEETLNTVAQKVKEAFLHEKSTMLDALKAEAMEPAQELERLVASQKSVCDALVAERDQNQDLLAQLSAQIVSEREQLEQLLADTRGEDQ